MSHPVESGLQELFSNIYIFLSAAAPLQGLLGFDRESRVFVSFEVSAITSCRRPPATLHWPDFGVKMFSCASARFSRSHSLFSISTRGQKLIFFSYGIGTVFAPSSAKYAILIVFTCSSALLSRCLSLLLVPRASFPTGSKAFFDVRRYYASETGKCTRFESRDLQHAPHLLAIAFLSARNDRKCSNCGGQEH